MGVCTLCYVGCTYTIRQVTITFKNNIYDVCFLKNENKTLVNCIKVHHSTFKYGRALSWCTMIQYVHRTYNT